MVQDVNLTSREWCELIFKGKNKQYGAYSLRQGSDKRHVSAILAIFAFVCAVIMLPSLMKSVSPDKSGNLGYTDVTKITEYRELPKPKELAIPVPEAPKASGLEKVRASIQYVPPKLVSSNDLKAESDIPITQNVIESSDAIHFLTTDGSKTEGKLAETEDPIPGDGNVINNPGPVRFAEQFPLFPGGEGELMKYLSKNLRYPIPSIEKGTEGKVTVQFVVEKNGKISNVKILQSLDVFCDKEAVRLISTMPDWIPGKQNGNPVSVYFTIPVRFKIETQK